MDLSWFGPRDGRLAALGLLGLFAVAGPAALAGAEEAAAPGAPAAGAEAAATPPPGTAGMRIYRDPITGRPVVPPPGARRVPPSPGLSRSAQGLVQKPGSSPAGGVTVDLQGRFRQAITATREADGKLKVGCVHAEPGGKE